MARKPRTQQTILEEARGEMSKVEFCQQLGISRPTYDKYLEGAYISLELLSYLAVDYADDWRGLMARELIISLHGAEFLPVGRLARIGESPIAIAKRNLKQDAVVTA
jgi:transcriptional regulator with XRE-family HTH domain